MSRSYANEAAAEAVLHFETGMHITNTSSRHFLKCAAVLLCTFVSGASQADIYTYVDKDGVVHFQNKVKKGKRVARAPKRQRPPAEVHMPDQVSRGTHRYDGYIREAATLYQIPEPLIRAVIKVESNFDPRAVSPANAHGLMQLLPSTAQRMMVSDIFDPRQNILGGSRYLRVLANLFNGNLELTIAAYNAGENAVLRYGGIPPYEETQNYVARVLAHYQAYRAGAD